MNAGQRRDLTIIIIGACVPFVVLALMAVFSPPIGSVKYEGAGTIVGQRP